MNKDEQSLSNTKETDIKHKPFSVKNKTLFIYRDSEVTFHKGFISATIQFRVKNICWDILTF